ncbi:39S ribosomal protein L12, mitochondrial [Microplitis mediator]|uniref:39S ribosomal protein L12, mitochondrial n=1 Tax=Microplitis mediator TaxID=375433 RepID=UPI00255396B3|nr:39S ribosomal protein L12, mitochondrial [Microplitis mediator]
MNTLRSIVQNKVSFRQFHSCFRYCQGEVATAAIPKLIIPAPEGTDGPLSPKIEKLVQDITALNLIEVAQLSDVLKKRLNLPDAPVMAVGSMAPKAQEEEEAAPQRVQTSFTVKLIKFDEKQKVALIKEMKTLMPNMNLVQAKKFVESVPTIVKADVTKEEAEKLKEAITKVGGEIEVA